jgi:tetratricopeptide (TPR) repeat protein
MRSNRISPLKLPGNGRLGGATNRDETPVSSPVPAAAVVVPANHGNKTVASDKAAHITSFGVSIGFLKLVRDLSKNVLKDSALITINDFVEGCVKEWTEGTQTALLDHLKKQYALDLHDALQVSFYSEYFAEATVYVSYARKYSLEGLVDTLELYDRQHSEGCGDDSDEEDTAGNVALNVRKDRKVYFWLDIFAVNQFVSFQDAKLSLGAVQTLIGKIGETCLVTMPYSNPLPFKRTWCLYEVLATHLTGATLNVQLSKTRHPNFLTHLADNYEAAIKSLNINIDVEASEAADQHTRMLMLDVFQHQPDGWHQANSVIANSIRHWAHVTAVRGIKNKMRSELELRMTERVEKHRTLSLVELLLLSFGCMQQPVDLTVFDPVERELANFHADCTTKLRLAALMNELKRYGEAEALYKVALAGNEKHFGSDHPATLSILGNLAFLYKTQCRFDESEELFVKVLQSKESTLGPAHPSTLTSMQNLASLLKDSGRPEEAIDMFRRSLTEQEAELGENHADTLASMEHLAQLYLDCGHNADAKAMLERLLQLKEGLYGARHKETAETYETAAALYVKEGMHAEAQELFRKALEAREALFGVNHPSTVATRVRLAVVQKQRKVYDEAEALFCRVLEVTERNFGVLHVSCFELTDHIVDIKVATGELETAEALLLELLGRKEDLLGVKSPSTLNTKFYLGEVYTKLKKYVLAETYHRNVLTWRTELLGEDHRDTAASLHGLATCLVYLKQLDEGKVLYERALHLFDTLEGPNNAHSVSTADCLATVCKVTGDVQQAENLLNRLKAHYRAIYGPNHPVTISFAKRLTSLLQS